MRLDVDCAFASPRAILRNALLSRSSEDRFRARLIIVRSGSPRYAPLAMRSWLNAALWPIPLRFRASHDFEDAAVSQTMAGPAYLSVAAVLQYSQHYK